MLRSLPTGVTHEILQRALQNEIETLHAEDEPYYENETHFKEPIVPKNEFETIIGFPSNLKLIYRHSKFNEGTKQHWLQKKWCKKINLEQMSQTLIFIEKHGLAFDELQNMATRKPQTMQNIKSEIETLDNELQHILLLQGTLEHSIKRKKFSSNTHNQTSTPNLGSKN